MTNLLVKRVLLKVWSAMVKGWKCQKADAAGVLTASAHLVDRHCFANLLVKRVGQTPWSNMLVRVWSSLVKGMCQEDVEEVGGSQHTPAGPA
jgi:hypothetical protein